MTFIKPKRVLAMKLETTSGTAIAVADADFNVRVRDIEFNPEVESYLRPYASGRHSVASAVMGKRKATVTFKHDLALGAAANTPAKVSKFFQCCGAKETITSTTSVDWTPLATQDEGTGYTGTIVIQEVPVSGNALMYTMKGCMGNFVLTMDDLGQPLFVTFTFTGAFVSITDGTALVLTSPDTSVPPAILAATITNNSVVQAIGKMSLDAGNEIQMDYDPSDATGYKAAYIGSRAPKLTLDAKATLLATDPVYTRWVAGTEAAFSLTTPTAGGFKWTITAPKAQLIDMKLGERNASVTTEQNFDLHESSGNDEWKIFQSA
jgi:hypothetical protein